MSRQFAKLFDTSVGQFLAVKIQCDDGKPGLQLSIAPSGSVFAEVVEILTTTGEYPDTDAGLAKRDERFAALDQTTAEEYATDMNNMFLRMEAAGEAV